MQNGVSTRDPGSQNTALARHFRTVLNRAAFYVLIAAILAAARLPSFALVTVTIDGAQTNQVIDGFGVNANYWSFQGNSLKPVIDTLIDGAGITHFRVVMNNGWETSNDNPDPASMNTSYYNAIYSSTEFQKLWGLLRYLNQRGLTNSVMLNFQGRAPSWMASDYLNAGMEDEWGEMVTSLVLFARTNQHVAFDLLAPNNEPDLYAEGMWIRNGNQYAATLHSLALDLGAYGISDLALVGPDLSQAVTNWMPEMMADPAIMARVGHFGTHNYSQNGGTSIGNLIKASAYSDRSLWVTEYAPWCSSCENGVGGTNSWSYALTEADYLLGQIKMGASAAFVWEGYDSYYPHHSSWSFWGLLAVDSTGSTPYTYTPRRTFYALSHYSKFVRPGARCLSPTEGTSDLESQAFYHDILGHLVVVGINRSATVQSLKVNLQNLPAFYSLHLYNSTSATNLEHTTVSVLSNSCTVSIPANSIYTLVATNPAVLQVTAQISAPADNSTYVAPAQITLAAEVATTGGTITNVSFYNGPDKLATLTDIPYSIIWSNVPQGTYAVTVRATNSLGNYGVSSPVHLMVAGEPDHIDVTPDTVELVPGVTQQFTAAIEDDSGQRVPGATQFDWSVNGGGSIDTNGLFAAGQDLISPIRVNAKAYGMTGRATVTIITNLAGAGTGYVWSSLASSANNTPRILSPAINDQDEQASIPLGPNGGNDVANAWEAAGVTWPTTQAVAKVVFASGEYNSSTHDGAFSAAFHLQFSLDGTTWNDASTNWTLTPAYSYNSVEASLVKYIFTGPPSLSRGVRCIGRVRTGTAINDSYYATAAEVAAYPPLLAAPQPPPILDVFTKSSGVVVSWDSALTNYLLETISSPSSQSWSSVTNTTVLGNEQRTTVIPTQDIQLFRLRGE
jgi:O-glycosyl hydrolase